MRERMKHLGGSLVIESELGQGTRIIAIAPLS
jgi:signal transduction histidine kinase